MEVRTLAAAGFMAIGLLSACPVRGEDLVVDLHEGCGSLTWEYPATNVESYRVDWAPQLGSPWTDFGGGSAALAGIAPTAASMSVSVPMFYRVVASVWTNTMESDVVYARQYGPPSYSTLTGVIGRIGGAPKTLVLDGGEWLVTGEVVLPANIALNVPSGSYIQVEGSGRLLGLASARPEWFGAQVNDGRGDAAAINAALDAANLVTLDAGEYTLERDIELRQGNSLAGEGKDRTVLKVCATDPSGFTVAGKLTVMLRSYGWARAENPVDDPGTPSYVHPGVTIRDLHLNGNLDGLLANGHTNMGIAAIRLWGEGQTIRNVKITQFGSVYGSAENFVVSVSPYATNAIQHSVADGVEFTDMGNMDRATPIRDGGHTLLWLSGWSRPHQNGVYYYPVNNWEWSTKVDVTAAKGIITNCVVHGIRNALETHTNAMFVTKSAFIKFAEANMVVNNHMYNNSGVAAMVIDTGKFDPLIVSRNYFIDAFRLITLIRNSFGATFRNVSIENNIVSVLPWGPSGFRYPLTVEFGGITATEPFTNYLAYPVIDTLRIMSNTVSRSFVHPRTNYTRGPFVCSWSTNNPLLGRHEDHPFAVDIEAAYNVWDGHSEMYYASKEDATNYFCRSIRIHNNRQHHTNAPSWMLYTANGIVDPESMGGGH